MSRSTDEFGAPYDENTPEPDPLTGELISARQTAEVLSEDLQTVRLCLKLAEFENRKLALEVSAGKKILKLWQKFGVKLTHATTDIYFRGQLRLIHNKTNLVSRELSTALAQLKEPVR